MNTTINLPESLLRKAKSYAQDHRTTLTALVIEQLESVISFSNDDPLVMFSRGFLTKNQVIQELNLRDYAELIIVMNDADLPMPLLPESEIDRQAEMFARLWSGS